MTTDEISEIITNRPARIGLSHWTLNALEGTRCLVASHLETPRPRMTPFSTTTPLLPVPARAAIASSPRDGDDDGSKKSSTSPTRSARSPRRGTPGAARAAERERTLDELVEESRQLQRALWQARKRAAEAKRA